MKVLCCKKKIQVWILHISKEKEFQSKVEKRKKRSPTRFSLVKLTTVVDHLFIQM